MIETYEFIKGDEDNPDRLKVTTPHEPMIREMPLAWIQEERRRLEIDLTYLQMLEAKYHELKNG